MIIFTVTKIHKMSIVCLVSSLLINCLSFCIYYLLFLKDPLNKKENYIVAVTIDKVYLIFIFAFSAIYLYFLF